MFTGIVKEVGTITNIAQDGDTRLRICCAREPESIDVGASIACNGICLSVIAKGRDDQGPWFDVEASAETVARTTLGAWEKGTAINIEPALRVGDELGGHIVAGHVDGVGEITDIHPEGASHRVTIEAPSHLARFIAAKGSITVDGISLTVNSVENTRFGVNVIPHTWKVTSFADAKVGKKVNLEIDLLARYVARLMEA